MLDALDSICSRRKSRIAADSIAGKQDDIAGLRKGMQCLQRNQVDAASVGHHKLQAIQAVDSFAPLSCFLAGFERLIVRRSNRR